MTDVTLSKCEVKPTRGGPLEALRGVRESVILVMCSSLSGFPKMRWECAPIIPGVKSVLPPCYSGASRQEKAGSYSQMRWDHKDQLNQQFHVLYRQTITSSLSTILSGARVSSTWKELCMYVTVHRVFRFVLTFELFFVLQLWHWNHQWNHRKGTSTWTDSGRQARRYGHGIIFCPIFLSFWMKYVTNDNTVYMAWIQLNSWTIWSRIWFMRKELCWPWPLSSETQIVWRQH